MIGDLDGFDTGSRHKDAQKDDLGVFFMFCGVMARLYFFAKGSKTLTQYYQLYIVNFAWSVEHVE